MSKIVLLDAGPLGMISNPNATGVNRECYEWMETLIVNGFQVRAPEIADYEVRRELLRANKGFRIESYYNATEYRKAALRTLRLTRKDTAGFRATTQRYAKIAKKNHFAEGTNLAVSTSEFNLISVNFLTNPKGGRDHVTLNGSFTPLTSR